MSKKQDGSAHVVIIIVLVMALIGALGWIFCRNLSAADDSGKTGSSVKKIPQKKTQDTVETTKLAMTDIYTDGLMLSYPEGWTVRHLPEHGDLPLSREGATFDTYILTSPDSTVDLSVSQMSGGGYGGTCDPDTEPIISSFSYEGSTTWKTMAYADYVVKREGSYLVDQGLASLENARKIHANETSCAVGYLYLLDTGKKALPDMNIMMSTSLSKHGVDGGVGFDTLDQAKAYLTGDNGQAVRNILLSIR